MQNKMTLRFHIISSRIAKKKKKTQVTAGEDVEKEEHTSIVGVVANWYNHSGIQSGSYSENWK